MSPRSVSVDSVRYTVSSEMVGTRSRTDRKTVSTSGCVSSAATTRTISRR